MIVVVVAVMVVMMAVMERPLTTVRAALRLEGTHHLPDVPPRPITISSRT